MKKALALGIAASFFFAFTFVLNRSMNLSGGSWIFSASLRFFFALPLIALLVGKKQNFQKVHQAIKKVSSTLQLPCPSLMRGIRGLFFCVSPS